MKEGEKGEVERRGEGAGGRRGEGEVKGGKKGQVEGGDRKRGERRGKKGRCGKEEGPKLTITRDTHNGDRKNKFDKRQKTKDIPKKDPTKF